MKYLTNVLFFVASLFCLQSQAMEVDCDESECPARRITVDELEGTVGKKNMEKVIRWAPQLDFMKANKVLMYSIGYDRISDQIAILRFENRNQEANELEQLIHPHKNQEVEKLSQSMTLVQIDKQ